MPTVPPASKGSTRIASIDIVRGIIMVLMAIDHVRVYAGVPAGGPTPALFFTRWVTHFCAPGFAFFAGTSAFLLGEKLRDRRALSKYLFTRGLILVLLELTYLHVAWTFTFDFSQMLAGVIWMLGWCMVLLAGLVFLPAWAVGILGLIIMGAQQLFRLLPQALPTPIREQTVWFWQLWYLGGNFTIGGDAVFVSVLYSIAPWIGVMAAGYGFGLIMRRSEQDRGRLCLRIGLIATILFLVLGSLRAMYGPAQDELVPFWARLLNQNKYRDSQLFLLMTLGPEIALLPFLEHARGWLASALTTFGRVPLFYYVMHIPLIHVLALITWRLRSGHVDSAWFATAPSVQIPEGDQWSLPLLYLVWGIAVVILYGACRWYEGVKARNPRSILRYI